MSFNRPLLPHYYDEAHQSGVIDSANDNNIRAGKGITLTKTTFGTTIHATQQGNQSALNWRGVYSFSSSYAPNDVVFVDPTVQVLDQNGNPLAWGSTSGSAVIPLCAGLFVCCFPVPPINQDSSLLENSLAPVYEAAGQQITSDFSCTFRHYALNVYYPIYPLISIYSGSALISSSAQCVTWVGEETWQTVANQTFWLPMAPMFTSSICTQNGTVSTTFVAGVVSGSLFSYQLPYPI